jgi:ubiquinone/menaquinone biosynthesis C-methylase UbiE
MAAVNAAKAGLRLDLREGNASAMPFADASFDFAYCSAAIKNFAEPLKALDEMHRVLRRGGEAVIVDLRKDVPLEEVDDYVRRSRRSAIDAWITRQVFRHLLIGRAYATEEHRALAAASRFGACQIDTANIGLEMRLAKAA